MWLFPLKLLSKNFVKKMKEIKNEKKDKSLFVISRGQPFGLVEFGTGMFGHWWALG